MEYGYLPHDYSIFHSSTFHQFSDHYSANSGDYSCASSEFRYPSYDRYTIHNKWYQSSSILEGFLALTYYQAQFLSMFMENQARHFSLSIKESADLVNTKSAVRVRDVPDYPRFKGQYPKIWLLRCQRYFQVNPTNEQEKVFMASLHLDGNVENWYIDCIEGLENLGWDSFSCMVIEKFLTHVGKLREKRLSRLEVTNCSIKWPSQNRKLSLKKKKKNSRLLWK